MMENLETIIRSIQSWKDLCAEKKTESFAQLFKGAIGMHFTVPVEMSEAINEQKARFPELDLTHYHAYPGMNNGELTYYFIHSAFDTEEQFEKGIFPYIVQTKILRYDDQVVGSPISPSEANRLIGNWDKMHRAWIPEQADNPNGMYRAFLIPEADIPAGKPLIGFFALKENLTNPETITSLLADLVFWDLKYQTFLGHEIYSDLARPVPPFKKGSALAEENFFLLTSPVPNEHL